MKQDYTHISILLDRSGSMLSATNDVRGGIKAYIEDQKKVDGQCTLSLYQFDDHFETDYSVVNIKDVNSDIVFHPRGMTALYDAIGRSIKDTGEKLSEMNEDDRPSKVLFVIFTDGAENASREYHYDAIKAMITEQTDKYNWEFVYLGANQDGMAVGANLGVKMTNSVSYDVGATASVYGMLSSKTISLRSGIADDFSFSDSERQDAVSKVSN